MRARGHFPSENASLNCVCLVVISFDRLAPGANAGPAAGSGPPGLRHRLRRATSPTTESNPRPTQLHRSRDRPPGTTLVPS
ncbi:hypothetical protein PV371_37810 [Streptomyces sp. TX20-6-3]|uniref:hypothetical protein n=1 Tax=Streptomyces sp. TX20-6-3 TaxID=3028705 RepID=UPI0029B7E2F4|nr:hypothetical protein [Streptomyces sp. TX20-6-3]MDX2565327.1 hypothetical protein [Streptomyces sp. TX20-6-3]